MKQIQYIRTKYGSRIHILLFHDLTECRIDNSWKRRASQKVQFIKLFPSSSTLPICESCLKGILARRNAFSRSVTKLSRLLRAVTCRVNVYDDDVTL